MTFSTEWDDIYYKKGQMSSWPWSDLISLVHRHCAHLIKNNSNVLELGCGAGANIPFFKALDINYYGIDGSETIIKHLEKIYPELKYQLTCGDFTSNWSFNEEFDLIFDRAALTHNNYKSIKEALKISKTNLKTGGIYIGVDYFSFSHTDSKRGKSVDDFYTRSQYAEGQFKGCGRVHFSDESHIRDLFSEFQILYLSEKIVKDYSPLSDHQFGSWNIVAKKNHG